MENLPSPGYQRQTAELHQIKITVCMMSGFPRIIIEVTMYLLLFDQLILFELHKFLVRHFSQLLKSCYQPTIVTGLSFRSCPSTRVYVSANVAI